MIDDDDGAADGGDEDDIENDNITCSDVDQYMEMITMTSLGMM